MSRPSEPAVESEEPTMSDEPRDLRAIVRQALTGRGAHVEVEPTFEGLGHIEAGELPDGADRTIYKILVHLVYWQDYCLAWLAGDKPETPEHAVESWPGDDRPAEEDEWLETLARFRDGLAKLDRHARTDDLLEVREGKTVLEVLQLLASHNSYHVGQVVSLRRGLGSWPPPGGGATW